MAALNNIGTTLAKGSPAVVIAGVKSITPPSITVDTVDVTELTSPGGWEESIPTVIRSGSLSATLNMDPTTHASFLTDIATRVVDTYTFTFNDLATPSTLVFDGFVESYSPADTTPDGALELTVSIKITGPVVFTAGS